ncbi:MAG: hypothetical protein ACKVK6_04945 [bacterium]
MITDEAKVALTQLLEDRVRFDAPMSRHTSLRIGGAADAIASPASPLEVEALLRACRRFGLSHTVLGNGFNTLVLDGGIEGVVILTNKLRLLEE